MYHGTEHIRMWYISVLEKFSNRPAQAHPVQPQLEAEPSSTSDYHSSQCYQGVLLKNLVLVQYL
jgi:hypothetical protein